MTPAATAVNVQLRSLTLRSAGTVAEHSLDFNCPTHHFTVRVLCQHAESTAGRGERSREVGGVEHGDP